MVHVFAKMLPVQQWGKEVLWHQAGLRGERQQEQKVESACLQQERPELCVWGLGGGLQAGAYLSITESTTESIMIYEDQNYDPCPAQSVQSALNCINMWLIKVITNGTLPGGTPGIIGGIPGPGGIIPPIGIILNTNNVQNKRKTLKHMW